MTRSLVWVMIALWLALMALILASSVRDGRYMDAAITIAVNVAGFMLGRRAGRNR